jgi:site-specific DNA-methyltransferase (cytosine-N4-specific)
MHQPATAATPPVRSFAPAGRIRDRRLYDAFAAIDWSFANSTPDPIGDLHPYPAKFIRDIPARALRLAPPGGLVVDPFCGVGTTLVEAVRAGRPSLGVDLNPIATLVARTKLSGWSSRDARSLPRHRERFVAAAIAGDRAALAEAARRIPRLDHWFDPVARACIAGATAYVQRFDPGDPWRDRLATALSSVIVRASRQESDTRYAAVDKHVTREVFAAWLARRVDRVAHAASRVAAAGDPATAEVHTGEAAHLAARLAGRAVGAAVFSPPYPNAYEYWLYHKYRMYWLGFDPLLVRAREIGARPFYSGAGKLDGADFARQMRPVFGALAGELLPDGIVLVVVGDSRIRGREVDNGALLIEIARAAGLRLVASTRRVIRRTRRSFNLSVARATDEHVLLFAAP